MSHPWNKEYIYSMFSLPNKNRSTNLWDDSWIIENFFSGGCNAVIWLSKIRRNLAIEFLDWNFASRRKLCKNSGFYGKIDTACVHFVRKGFYFLEFWLRPVSQVHTISQPFWYWYSVPDLQISARLVTVDTFNRLRRKKLLPENMRRK